MTDDGVRGRVARAEHESAVLIGCWCEPVQREKFNNRCEYHQGFEEGADAAIAAMAACLVVEHGSDVSS